MLPDSIRNKHLIRYDIEQYDLRKEIMRMLQQLDPEMVGTFRKDTELQELKLENFVVPQGAKTEKEKRHKSLFQIMSQMMLSFIMRLTGSLRKLSCLN